MLGWTTIVIYTILPNSQAYTITCLLCENRKPTFV